MSAPSSDSADLVPRLRQQVILAQVRIMELEDLRDSLTPQISALQAALDSAQTLADAKIDEASHLESVRAELDAQCRHWQHVQHVTNEALVASRSQLEATSARLAEADQRGTQLQRELVALADCSRQFERALGDTQSSLAKHVALAAAHEARIAELDRELRSLKTSRSWRWTRWLRSLERLFRRKP